ncbi:comEA protein [Desulfacinum infernum DSM 9756]|uniref:ComEA protein n=1 Tax=Desulfacinum infernum DSM 9756 TaxID=1121391 RepID=A0A1M5GGD8_9BACT|nr:ComEA family DNA-binding protein [Desulfacinum infernum]SHG02779.1 comEA protein [Desulfacinum infernum DSM 9756]
MKAQTSHRRRTFCLCAAMVLAFLLTAAASTAAATDLVNINTADAEQLQSLPGIGPAIAQRIVEYRTQNGPFKQKEDIQNVQGIGPKKYEAIKDLITVE